MLYVYIAAGPLALSFRPLWRALGPAGYNRGAREGCALGPKSLRVTNGKGKGKTKSGEEECKKRLPAVNAAPAVKFTARMQVLLSKE